MSEKKKELKAISLKSSKEYTAFQFYAALRMISGNSEDAFRFTVLNVLKWLNERRGTDEDEYEPDKYISFDTCSLSSFKVDNETYLINVTYMPDTKEWALFLREPDTGVDGRDPVNGRLFITKVAVKVLDDRLVELACKIDVTDPVEAEEVGYGYRPLFIRWLFESTQKIEIFHNRFLLSMDSWSVASKNDIKEATDMFSSEKLSIPLVFFADGISIDLPPVIKNPSPVRALPCLPSLDGLQIQKSSGRSIAGAAQDFSLHNFGYCSTYVIKDTVLEQFSQRINRKIAPCSVLVKYPARFGGGFREYKNVIVNGEVNRRILADIKDEVRGFSKRKDFYYGSVKFQDDLDKEELERTISKRIGEETGRLSGVSSLNDSLSEEVSLLKERIRELEETLEKLKAEKENEYNRAKGEYEIQIENRDNKIKELEDSIKEFSDSLALAREQKRQALEKREYGSDTISLKMPETKEFYPEEYYDLILSVLAYSKSIYRSEDSRASELIDEIIKNNSLVGNGLEWLEKIKKIFVSNSKGLGAGEISTLRDLGFTVPDRKTGSGHIEISMQGRKRYRFTAASTPSDRRTNTNLYSEMEEKLSVYKNPARK